MPIIFLILVCNIGILNFFNIYRRKFSKRSNRWINDMTKNEVERFDNYFAIIIKSYNYYSNKYKHTF